jgi:hypothetical protein
MNVICGAREQRVRLVRFPISFSPPISVSVDIIVVFLFHKRRERAEGAPGAFPISVSVNIMVFFLFIGRLSSTGPGTLHSCTATLLAAGLLFSLPFLLSITSLVSVCILFYFVFFCCGSRVLLTLPAVHHQLGIRM